jgi:hypothetical protein
MNARRIRSTLITPAVLTALALALSMPATAAQAKASAADQLRAHMRKLWEDHVTWTRLYIVSVAAGLPDKDDTAKRLLQNQVDIGNAIKPWKMHLDLTLKEALDRFGSKYAEDIQDYDQVHDHILGLADTLTNGITAQFPDRVKRS